MDLRGALINGTDIPVPECQLVLHQPKLEEISYMGESDFFTGVQTLCLYKSMFIEDKNVLEEVSNFQIFMTVMQEKETADKKRNVVDLMSILLPTKKVLFTPMSMIIQGDGESITVDESNFDNLQNVLREIFCSKTGPMDQSAFNPVNDKAKEIAQKLMRGRQRVAQQKGSSTSSVFCQYESILSVGLQLPITTFKNYTLFQLYDQFERYML